MLIFGSYVDKGKIVRGGLYSPGVQWSSPNSTLAPHSQLILDSNNEYISYSDGVVVTILSCVFFIFIVINIERRS